MMNVLKLRQQYLDDLEVAHEVVQSEGTEFFKRFGIKVVELVGRIRLQTRGLQRDPKIVFANDPTDVDFTLAYGLLTARLHQDKVSKEDWGRVGCLLNLIDAAKKYLEAK